MDEQTKHDDTSLFGTDFDAIDKFIISSLSDFYHTYKDTSTLIYEDTHKPVQESDLHQRFKSSESNLYDLSRKYEDNPPGAYDKPVLLSKNIFEVGAYFHRLDEVTGFMGGPSKMGESPHSFIRKLEDIQRLCNQRLITDILFFTLSCNGCGILRYHLRTVDNVYDKFVHFSSPFVYFMGVSLQFRQTPTISFCVTL